jgi:putative membrane protein
VWLLVVGPGLAYAMLWTGTARLGPIAHRRRRAFLAGTVALAMALLSPLDALSASLASAHMVQHLLLTTVAAPLLVLGAPAAVLVAALPPDVRRRVASWRTGAAGRAGAATLAHPVVVSLPFVATLWWWHARAPYEAALADPLVHGLAHVSLVATALLSWAAILRHRRRPATPGVDVLVLFGLATLSGLLGLLLTFAPTPWYSSYAETTAAWGLTPLADQQLAGVIMWVPGGGAYVVAALVLVRSWVRPSSAGPVPVRSARF